MMNLEQKLITLLEEHNYKLSTAESCTGGLVAAKICGIPGISTYYEEGFITYSKTSKNKNLGVPLSVMEQFGIVSCETAEEMAKGAQRKTSADCAIATTGIAGPQGGTSENPVGTVCFAWTVGERIFSKKVRFDGGRNEVRNKAAAYALEQLCDYIEKIKKE